MLIPYHINLLSCIFLNNSPTFAVPQIISFLILYGLVTPLILISATSNFLFCALFNAHVSAPYIIAGLTAVLHTFPLTLKLIHRSHWSPDTLLQFFPHPDCILCVISASKSPFSANAAPRYFNLFTLSKFSSLDCVLSSHPIPISIEPQIVFFYWSSALCLR